MKKEAELYKVVSFIIITALSLLIQESISKTRENSSVWVLVLGFVIAVILYFGIVYFFTKIDGYLKQIQTFKESLREIIEKSKKNISYHWLLDGRQVLEHDKKHKGHEVWVASYHLKNDTDDKYIDISNNIVKEAINRKIDYYYLLPDTKAINQQLAILQKNYDNKAKVILLDPIKFAQITHTEVVVYRDFDKKDRFFLELPVDDKEKGEHVFWVEPDLEFAKRMTKLMETEVNKYKAGLN